MGAAWASILPGLLLCSLGWHLRKRDKRWQRVLGAVLLFMAASSLFNVIMENGKR
jgi:uncharacterized membrane protein YdcZ (DUF606 family)